MVTRTWCICLFVVFVVGLLLNGSAQAQSAKEKAVTLARAGVALMEEGKLDDALKMFEEAYRLDPAPLLFGHMAKVYEKKGDALKAREFYERWVASETDPKRLEKAKARLAELLIKMFGKLTVEVSPAGAVVKVDDKEVQPGVPLELPRGLHKVEVTLRGYNPDIRTVEVTAGTETNLTIELKPLHGTIEVRGGPRGAIVTVNGADPRSLPLDKPYKVPPGLHVVEVSYEGFEKMVKTVQVGAGETVSIEVRLALLPKKEPTTPSKPAQPVVEKVGVEVPQARRSPWPWLSVGVGVASIGVGVIMNVLASQEREKVRDAQKDGNVVTGMPMTEAKSHVDKARTYDKVSYVMYGVGGAAMVSGVILAITLHPKAAKASNDVPIVGASFLPGGGAVSLEGRF